MPRFEVEQNGKRYEVEADSPEAALEAVESMQGPTVKGPGLAAAAGATGRQRGSFLDPLMQGVTLGAADEIRGGIRGAARYAFGDNSGKSLGDLYNEEVGGSRQNLEAFRERRPWAAPALEVGGAGLGVLATGGASLVPRAATTAGKIGVGLVEGTGIGGLYGFNAGEGGAGERLKSAAISAPLGAIGGAAGGAVSAAMGRGARTAAPSLDDLSATADAAFDSMRASGVALQPRKADVVVNAVLKVAAQKRINPTLHPDSYARLRDVVAIRGTSPSVADLHELRQIVAQAAESPKPADKRMANLLLDALDDQIDNLNAFDVTGPNPRAAVASLREGMSAWHRFRKGQTIAKIFSDAEVTAGANYTQSGMENALRQGFKALAKNEKKLRGFTPEERAAIRKVAMGGPLENVMRFFGKFAPRGLFSGGGLVSVTAMEPTLGLPYLLLSEGGRMAATSMAKNNVRLADELVRRGGPARPPKPLTKAQQAELALILGSGLPAGSMLERQFR